MTLIRKFLNISNGRSRTSRHQKGEHGCCKGIVSRDFLGLQMILMDRAWVPGILLESAPGRRKYFRRKTKLLLSALKKSLTC